MEKESIVYVSSETRKLLVSQKPIQDNCSGWYVGTGFVTGVNYLPIRREIPNAPRPEPREMFECRNSFESFSLEKEIDFRKAKGNVVYFKAQPKQSTYRIIPKGTFRKPDYALVDGYGNLTKLRLYDLLDRRILKGARPGDGLFRLSRLFINYFSTKTVEWRRVGLGECIQSLVITDRGEFWRPFIKELDTVEADNGYWEDEKSLRWRQEYLFNSKVPTVVGFGFHDYSFGPDTDREGTRLDRVLSGITTKDGSDEADPWYKAAGISYPNLVYSYANDQEIAISNNLFIK